MVGRGFFVDGVAMVKVGKWGRMTVGYFFWSFGERSRDVLVRGSVSVFLDGC